MTRPGLLTEEQLSEALSRLFDHWGREGEELTALFSFSSYGAAVSFVTGVAAIAQELDHHPVITLSYGTVRVAVTTHDAGGLTSLDVALAERSSELYASSKLS
ncbi:MAG: 4a-hydroxytetrahydrobiopterin dehydratase [Actinomycetota bacterium]